MMDGGQRTGFDRINMEVPNMLRIGICDDEADARDALYIQLEKVLLEGSEEVVYDFSSGAGAVRWLKNHPGEIDLLFLDVEMDGMSGMEAAEEIRKFDTEIRIVFVTGYTDYVFEGYRVNAFDYIIKPAQAKRLDDLLKRVRSQMYRERERYYTLKNTDGTFRFAVFDISYFYSEKRKVTLVLGEKEYAFYGRLDEVEEALDGSFVRIHQRYLVNPQKVDYIGADNVRLGERSLPISRAMKESATAKLAKAMLGGEL